jgi:UDP-glucose:tetrahydrobiopterin glucosyltransferase
VLLVSTPIGVLGSGTGGGVELTVLNVARALQRLGHRPVAMGATGSSLPGVPLLTASGVPPPPAQSEPRDAPVRIPAGSLVANFFDLVRTHQDDFDVVINFGYDWLPIYLTPFFRSPLCHVVGMGSLGDAVDDALVRLHTSIPGRLACHTRAQAATFPFPDAFRILGNGFDLDRYTFQAQAEPALAWVARIAPEKGLEDAAAAAAAAALPLRVFGVIEDEAYWAGVLRSVPEGAIEYCGFLPTAALQRQLGRCRALLVTPKWEEAFGNVIAEALACGVPVITYDRGGPAELVRDGESGTVVAADSVPALVEAIARIDAIDRAACRRHADQEFSLDALGERLDRWLDDVITGNPSGPATRAPAVTPKRARRGGAPGTGEPVPGAGGGTATAGR